MLASSPTQTLLLGTFSTATSAYTGVTTGASQPIEVKSSDELTFYFESAGTGTTSGGTLLIEEASRWNYGGTWSQIASVAASSFTGLAQVAYHISPSAFGFVRVRISSTITGEGTVVVFMNKQGS